MPHELYCQLFYSCDANGNRFVSACPSWSSLTSSNTLAFNQLFAFGEGIGTCMSGPNFGSDICPYWPSAQLNVQQQSKYPDVCCNKYWRVSSVGNFVQETCPGNQRFDNQNGICVNTNNGQRCSNQLFDGVDYCYETFSGLDPNDPNNAACPHSPINVPGKQCLYTTAGFDVERKCPSGTSFDSTRCGCTVFNEGCLGNVLTPAQLRLQKAPDANCNPSGKMSFSNLVDNFQDSINIAQPLVYSQKLNNGQQTPVDHYFTMRQVSFNDFNNPNSAKFSGAGAYLYDYYYVDNPLYASFVINMRIKFDYGNNGYYQTNQEYMLLQNNYYSNEKDGSVRDIITGEMVTLRENQQDTAFCGEPTIYIKATYLGNTQGQSNRRNWRFEFGARGERDTQYANLGLGTRLQYNQGSKVSTSTQANQQTTAHVETQNDSDTIRLTYVFNGAVSGQIAVFANSGQLRGSAISLASSGSTGDRGFLNNQIGTNKCGFLIGRNFQGTMNQFDVHEGCGDPNVVINGK